MKCKMAAKVAQFLRVYIFAENLARHMGNCSSSWDDAVVLFREDFSGGLGAWDFELADAWQYGFGQFGNFEQQFYTKDAVRVEDGLLKITAAYTEDVSVVEQLCWDECAQRCIAAGKRPGTVDFEGCMNGCGNTGRRCKNLGERGITSGRIFTKEGVLKAPTEAYPVVRMETRIRLPEPGLGLWAAAWLLPPKENASDPPGTGTFGPWPRSGEIDVMETANDFKKLNGTIHYGTPENHLMGSVALKNFTGGDGKFHTYGIEWRRVGDSGETLFKWFVDDKFYGAFPSPGNPFDVEEYGVLLNLAVGGNFTEWEAGRVISVADTQEMLKDRPRTMEVCRESRSALNFFL